jgi:hypothetical protein
MKFVWLCLIMIFGGCTKEQFTTAPREERMITDPVKNFQNMTCANSTTVKPPVDILYVVDNSMSAQYLSSTVRSQIRQTIDGISQNFDYRVMVAPLFSISSTETNYPIVTNNAASLPPGANVVNLESINFFNTTSGGNSEEGFKRVIQLIELNRPQIFRNNAHTIIVMVSNGDDTGAQFCLNGQCTTSPSNFSQWFNELKSLRSSLHTESPQKQFRFFSLVAHSNCQSGWVRGQNYINMSKQISQDLNQSSSTDTFDICSGNLGVFSGVNETIRQLIVPHVYDRWPVSSEPKENIVVESVHRMTAQGQSVLIPESGFEVIYSAAPLPTRILPSVGEPTQGTMIQLKPEFHVTFPDCLVVKTRTPTEYYQYVVLSSDPQVETIILRIRGENIPQDSTNGWSFVGYRERQNIKIRPLEDGSFVENSQAPLFKTGYFLELHGSARYGSGETVEIFYSPKPF